MPLIRTHIINSEFSSSDDGQEYSSLDEASRRAVHAASDIARDLMLKGSNPSVVEVELEQAGRVVAKHVVTLTTAPLQVA